MHNFFPLLFNTLLGVLGFWGFGVLVSFGIVVFGIF